MKKYLVVEQGEYSDYGVSIVDITDCPLTEEEILVLLKIDQWDNPTASGEINGEIKFYDNSSISIKNIKEEAKDNINSLFACHGKNETVLDREYSKEELLEIATKNDRSGVDYWKDKINNKYEEYLKGYMLYKKLSN
jgi:hypothetical protein